MKRIFLIGYRCTGKTSVGKALAQTLNKKFIDLDEFIVEKAGRQISEIVAEHGWPHFRALEKQVLQEVVNNPEPVVVSCGGGAVLHEELLPKIKASGLVVWLKADVAVILDRLLKDSKSSTQRPSLVYSDVSDKTELSQCQQKEEIWQTLQQRLPLYEKWADVTVQTDDVNVNEVVQQIIHLASNRACHFEGGQRLSVISKERSD